MEDGFLRDPLEGSNGKEVSVSLCAGRLASAVTATGVVNSAAGCECIVSSCRPPVRADELYDNPAVTTLVARVKVNKRQETIDVILDSGSDGHILPVSVMTEVRET